MKKPLLGLLVLAVFGTGLPVCRGEVADPARLAPESSILYLEVTRPDALLGPALAPSTYELAQGIPAYKQYLDSDQYRQARAGTALVEAQLGTDWRTAVSDVLGGGVYLAFDPAGNSALWISRSTNPELLNRLNKTLADLIEADARNNARESPVKSKEYNGVVGWSFGPNQFHAIIGDLLVSSNNADALKAAIDRSRQAGSPSLANVPAFAEARAARPAEAAAWAWAGLDTIRKLPNVEKALSSPNNNPLGELLLGGVLEAARHAPYAAASLHLDGGTLRLRAYMPRDAAQVAPARSWYFAEAEGVPAGVELPGTIATLSLVRDLAGFWLSRGDLFDEQTVAGFAQADTQLGLFFSGRDFGSEVLGELKPGWQFIVVRQEFRDQPVPALKLPAMALVLTMEQPDDFAKHLLIAYQKVIGLTNIVGGQQGQPQLLLASEEYQGASISTASYLAPQKAEPGKAPLNYNFSPACARVGDRFVFGSTIGIVKQLVDVLGSGGSAVDSGNFELALQAAPLAAILDDNRELLISQNMLAQGNDRGEAEQAIATLLQLIKAVNKAGLRLTTEPSMLGFELLIEADAPSP